MSKGKGSRFERKIGKTLSKWLTGGHDKTQLIRSVQSGGWSARKDNQLGDLAANGAEGRKFREVFVIECKAQERFSWTHVWSSKDPALSQWWEQVNTEANEHSLVPLLVYSKNYAPNLVGLPPDLTHTLFPESRRMIVRWGPLDKDPIGLVELDEFLTQDPDYVIHCGKEYLETR